MIKNLLLVSVVCTQTALLIAGEDPQTVAKNSPNNLRRSTDTLSRSQERKKQIANVLVGTGDYIDLDSPCGNRRRSFGHSVAPTDPSFRFHDCP